jgi:hypothetical protein
MRVLGDRADGQALDPSHGEILSAVGVACSPSAG